MRPLEMTNLSQNFSNEAQSFTNLTKQPASVLCTPKNDGIYAISIEKTEEKENILMKMGHVLEKILTMSKRDFQRLKKSAPNPLKLNVEDGYTHCQVIIY